MAPCARPPEDTDGPETGAFGRSVNVLMLTSSFPRYEGDYSGPWILEYCRELVRQGHRVTVVCPGVTGTGRHDLSADGLDVVRFRYAVPRRWETLAHPPGMIPQLKANPLRYLQLPSFLAGFHLEIARQMSRVRFDVVHSQWAIPAGYLGGRLAAGRRIPHVITSQGAEFFLPPAHPFSRFTRAALDGAAMLMPVSGQMAERATDYGASPERTRVVPNSVNTDVFRPQASAGFRERHGIDAGHRVILTIRRLVFEKRVEDVIDAFAALQDRRDAILVVGGDGPERAALERRCERLGLRDGVRFIGFVDNADLPPIYAAADAYVLSSQQEGLSLSLLEAMASGLAVITTASTGGDELVRPGENGFVYPVGDTTALTRILGELLDAPAERMREIGRAARRTVVDDYSVPSMVRALVGIYREVATSRGSPPSRRAA